MSAEPELDRKLSTRPTMVREFVKAHPKGRLKAVEFDSMGGVRRVEWFDDGPEDKDDEE